MDLASQDIPWVWVMSNCLAYSLGDCVSERVPHKGWTKPISISLSLCVDICICICMYVCIYIYIYICIYIYIYMHIHMQTYVFISGISYLKNKWCHTMLPCPRAQITTLGVVCCSTVKARDHWLHFSWLSFEQEKGGLPKGMSIYKRYINV